ncbi:hypothetical protein FS749_009296, partial [Ceratobasidium sp. UAMH 11750]
MMRTSSFVRALQTLNRPIYSPINYLQHTLRCKFSSSASTRDEDTSGEDSAFKKNLRAKVDPQTVKDWFRSEGLPYLNPTPGKPNWLGGDV